MDDTILPSLYSTLAMEKFAAEIVEANLCGYPIEDTISEFKAALRDYLAHHNIGDVTAYNLTLCAANLFLEVEDPQYCFNCVMNRAVKQYQQGAIH